MSADVSHVAIGRGFLGHLVERTQGQATLIQTPILERRRPGIFEPRTPAPANTLDIAETTVASGASSFIRAPAPPIQTPVHASRASAINTSVVTPQIATTGTIAIPSALPPQITSGSRAAQIAAPLPAPAMTKPRDMATAATRSSRGKAAREIPAGRFASPTQSIPSPALSGRSPPPVITVPQAIAVRSAHSIRVEQSRLESRTTVIEREVDKHRDSPAPTAQAPMLKAPPRLTSSEAPRTPVAHPVRSAAMLAVPSAPVAPTPVLVSIGRVEIRGFGGAPAPATARSAASKPQLGLDEYLQQRHGNVR